MDATNFKLFANEPCRPPLLPLWPGFIINTAFYSAFFVAIWIVPELVRPYYRRRRNLCPACGYDLRGLAAARCPECGRDATSTQPMRP